MGELLVAPVRQLLLHEHRRGDLAARDVDDRRGLPVREPDRVEHEHVALELAMRDPTLGHRRHEVRIRDAREQGQVADQRVVPLEAGWYHPARTDRCALMDG